MLHDRLAEPPLGWNVHDLSLWSQLVKTFLCCIITPLTLPVISLFLSCLLNVSTVVQPDGNRNWFGRRNFCCQRGLIYFYFYFLSICLFFLHLSCHTWLTAVTSCGDKWNAERGGLVSLVSLSPSLELSLQELLSVTQLVLTCNSLVFRLSQAVLVVPLGLLDFECRGDFLHPPGARPLHHRCGGGVLHYHAPLLVVSHDGQPAGEHRRVHRGFRFKSWPQSFNPAVRGISAWILAKGELP